MKQKKRNPEAKGWGGPGRGQGRKPAGDEPRIRIQAYVDAATAVDMAAAAAERGFDHIGLMLDADYGHRKEEDK